MHEVAGLAFSLLIAYAGRDRVWTPKFKGTEQARFEQAVRHYQVKMGFENVVLEFATDSSRTICSSVQQRNGFGPVKVTWMSKSPRSCKRARPEFWALHEACHIRYAHHARSVVGKAEEDEAKKCMKLYSAKERR